MRIVIPTYRRTELLQARTLAYLERSEVIPEDVTILVANEQERYEYDCALDASWADQLEIGAPGLSDCRNYAHTHTLEPGVPVLWIDDDVSSIRRRLNDKETEEVPVYEVAAEGFAATEATGARLWGVYPTVNPLFMKPKLRRGLWHVVGPFYGVISDPDPRLQLEYGDAKEDYERTLRHYEVDGEVLRLDWFAVETTYYRKDAGGISGRTPDNVQATVRRLQNRWPGLVRHNPRRKSEFPEILLQRSKVA